MNGLSLSEINAFRESFETNAVWKAAMYNFSRSAFSNMAFDPIAAGRLQPSFSVEIKTLPVTDQKSSGRCWLFAGLNLLREVTAKKLNLENFELSQNYMAFYDKLEKANYMLESIIVTADRDIDDRTVCWILSTGLQDGGQWDMLVSLIKKYGVVPKYAMQETFQSSKTAYMNDIANMRLREYAYKLRGLCGSGAGAEEVQQAKSTMMGEFYAFLVMCFGRPPERFDFECTDKDGAFHADRDMTPLSFYNAYVGVELDDYVSLINAPTPDKPMNRSYTVKFLGNVADGRNILYVNVEMEKLKAYVVNQLKDGEPVWFGSDVTGKYGDRKSGVWDTACFDYQAAIGIPFGMDKPMQLDYRDSCMTHAMLITGVNLTDGGKPNRWKIENSWGDENGVKGYYIGGDGWFDRYVYQAVINKKYLDEATLAAAASAPIELNPWDPMGSLA